MTSAQPPEVTARGGGEQVGTTPGPVDFDAFVLARSTALLRTAYLLTRDRGLAEDLVQTALAKAWVVWHRVEGDPEGYVRRILTTTYVSWWRRRWRGEHATELLPERGEAGGAEQVPVAHDLWEALGRLPARQRAVVVLRYFEDLTEAQTARALGCAVGTVKSQHSKALATLRIDRALAEDDDAGEQPWTT